MATHSFVRFSAMPHPLRRCVQGIGSPLTVTSLMVLLGGSVSLWMLEAIVTPQVVRAYTERVDLALDRQDSETFETMVRRAESVARAAAQRSFDRDILISEVSVIVIGRFQGTEAPILSLEVNRNQWRSRPDTRRWATYFKMAKTLLRLDRPIPIATPAIAPPVQRIVPPATTPVPLPPGIQQPPIPINRPSPGLRAPAPAEDIPPEDDEG